MSLDQAEETFNRTDEFGSICHGVVVSAFEFREDLGLVGAVIVALAMMKSDEVIRPAVHYQDRQLDSG